MKAAAYQSGEKALRRKYGNVIKRRRREKGVSAYLKQSSKISGNIKAKSGINAAILYRHL